jgi:SAM-dependent methyltransferase
MLAAAVPIDTWRILDVGCGDGCTGAYLRGLLPGREVYGIERNPQSAAVASRRLDAVYALDVDGDDPPLQAGSLDCLMFGDSLGRLSDPLAVLRRLRRFLKPGGLLLASVPNLQHQSVVAALLRGENPGNGGAAPRAYTWSTLFKLLLDANFVPEIVSETSASASPGFLQAAEPLLKHLGLHPERTRRYLEADRYVACGTLLPEPPRGASEPLTIATCVNDEDSLRSNLLASPCLRPGTPHEVLAARGCRGIADGLNAALARAKNRWVVCVHQDVYLPDGWDRVLTLQLQQAEDSFGSPGVAGVIGQTSEGMARPGSLWPLVGWVVDRDRVLKGPDRLPAIAETLDELVLVLPKGTPLRFDATLGFHLYGADLCLQAKERGLAVAALEALCFHNSRGVDLPADFHTSGRVFAQKWAHRLPVQTTCAVIDRRWLTPEMS